MKRLAVLTHDVLSEADYDPGLLNDYGGGNVGWWMDYIRHEVNRCNDYWRTLLESSIEEIETP